ncbi:CDP-glycerol glycerophosphotransferase family protein [Providencia sp. PROV254]|uniref:CDP-glycerol glycerophosphotransferase family protein n=1 Tax=Providencia sp. PROV254 TaxID=2949942 RepID=UPI002349FA00|nr:CDP-glycerol glycerophosphotransferase family protein [Providencia sp. PROV254]
MKKLTKNKYLILRITHFLKGLLFSFFYSFIYTKRKKIIIFNSSCNQDFTWNAKSLFINGREQLNKLGYKTLFVINDEKKRNLLKKKYGDYFINNQSIKEIHLIYTSAVWILSTLETPCSGIFLNKNRFVFHLGHGTPIKNIGLCENKISILKKIFYLLNDTNISLYLSTSEYFAPYMKNAFGTNINKIITAPQPRIFDITNTKKNKNNLEFKSNKKYILYAPTWRPYLGLKIFPFESFNVSEVNAYLEDLNIIILLRLHPRFEDNLEPFLHDNIINYDTSLCSDISDSLMYTDAIITDYSSIFCDYLILNKPVAVLPYDIEQYTREVGFSHDYKDIFPNYTIYNQNDFLTFCKLVSENKFNTSPQTSLCKKLNFIPEDGNVIEYNIKLIDTEYNKRWKLE